MGMPKEPRQPCPIRVLYDARDAFGMGVAAGSGYHFLMASTSAPKGKRFVAGGQAARMNALRVGGNFAVWGGLFSAFDCSMFFLLQKEEPWNTIIAGAATAGLLSTHKGAGAAGRSALMGGALLALIEGASLMLKRAFPAPQNLPPFPADDLDLAAAIAAGGGGGYGGGGFPGLPQPPMPPTEVASSSGGVGWLGGLFGKKEEKKPAGSGAKSEILESFETPSAPVP